MEAASCRAVRTTFVGSMMPVTRSPWDETSCFDLLVIVELIAVHKTGFTSSPAFGRRFRKTFGTVKA